MSETRIIQIVPELSIAVAQAGDGRPALVLHGGGGPDTVAPISAHLAETMRTLTPTHPGWNGRPRPDRLATIGDLAAVYLQLLAAEGLTDVLVVGSSIGGWIACEMAVRDEEAAIAGLVLVDSVGIAVDGQPIIDFFSLTPRQIADESFYDGDAFFADPAELDPAQAQAMQDNMATLRALAGEPYMHDPELRDRLAGVTAPALAVWGDSDGIVSPDYGRALASSLPDCRFELIEQAGHLPQLERPDALFALIDAFAGPGGRLG